MNIRDKYSDQTFRLFCCISVVTMAMLLTINTSHALKTDGFVEIGHDEFKRLLIGNTMKGVYRGGQYYDYYDPTGKLPGTWKGWPQSAGWELGEGNCVLLLLERESRKCWILLKNPAEETYYFGKKSKKGKYNSMHESKILQGAQY